MTMPTLKDCWKEESKLCGSFLSVLLCRKTPDFQLSKCPAFKNLGIKEKKQYNNFKDTTENRGALPERGRSMACTYFSQGEEFPNGRKSPKGAFHIWLSSTNPKRFPLTQMTFQKQGERDENGGSDHKSVICSNSGRANKASFSKCGS